MSTCSKEYCISLVMLSPVIFPTKNVMMEHNWTGNNMATTCILIRHENMAIANTRKEVVDLEVPTHLSS